MIIRELFTCPIFQQKIENIDLKEYVLFLNKKQKGRNVSNRGGWQSNDFYKPKKQFKNLWEIINISLNEYHKCLGLKGYVSIDNLWFNINYKNNFNITHNHPSSVHSGTFYINTPENCGSIVFHHPSNLVSWTYKNQYIKNYNVINSSLWSFPVEKDWLYIFPSWTNHHVDPNLSDEVRISLAFNSIVKK